MTPPLRTLFVYGTLKRGGHNHALVAHADTVVPAHTPGALYDLPGGYPALLPGAAHGVAHGELLTFATLDGTLEALDAFEGYDPCDPAGSEYLREAVTVTLEHGAQVTAWAYTFTPERVARYRAVHVPAGRWDAHAPRPFEFRKRAGE